MKKIFTLLFAAGMITMVQAQPGTRDNRQGDRRDIPPVDQRDDKAFDQRDRDNQYNNDRDVAVIGNHNPWDNNDDRYGNNDNRYGNSPFGNERRMRMQLAQINREFDYKIERVRNSFFMSRWEKQRQMRFLEEQRQQEIRKVYFKFKYNRGNNDRGYNDRGYNDRDIPDHRHY
jgi:hypothetical protein